MGWINILCGAQAILESALRAGIQGYTAGIHCPKVMKPPHSLILQMVERVLPAQPDSVANHVTDRSISNRRALT